MLIILKEKNYSNTNNIIIITRMGANKRDYMNYYDHATLHDVIQKYNLDMEEQEEYMMYETLCDYRSKSK
tara:strand:+ start:277 stop:486 length:210 start_codon:yes stop_codon:yes gene_type:complete